MSQNCKISPFNKIPQHARGFFESSATLIAASNADIIPSKSINMDNRVFTKIIDPNQERKVYERLFHEQLKHNISHGTA